MSRFKKPEKGGISRKERVFHDSTNTFRKDAFRLNSATPHVEQVEGKNRSNRKTDSKLKYSDSATPKVDNRNKRRLNSQVDSNSDTDLQQQTGGFRNQLFVDTEKSAHKDALNTEHNVAKLSSFAKKISLDCQLENNNYDGKGLEQNTAHPRGDAKKSDLRTISVQEDCVMKEHAFINHRRDEGKKRVYERTKDERVEDKISNEKSPYQNDSTSLEHVLRGPTERRPTDAFGRPIVTKEALQRAIHAPVDNAPVLKAMLESCRKDVSDGIGDDYHDWNSTQVVSLSTAFGVTAIDTSNACAASADESDLTLMSSDDDDDEEDEQLELPPGWKQVWSRSKNKPYYIHPDHGRTWYCPALIRRRKKRKYANIVTTTPPLSRMIPPNGKIERKSTTHQHYQDFSSCGGNTITAFQKSERDDRCNYEDMETYPSNNEESYIDESSLGENSIIPSEKDRARILLQTDEDAKYSNSELSTEYEASFNGRITKKTDEDKELHHDRVTCSHALNQTLCEDDILDATMEASPTEDDYSFDTGFNQANESPDLADAMSPSPCADRMRSDYSASPEEGSVDELFSESEDDSSRWISYPTVPRCSLQYVHQLVEA